MSPERVPVLRAERIHGGLRLCHILARRRMVARILFEEAHALAWNFRDRIFHRHGRVFARQKVGEVVAEILAPERAPHRDRRLDEIVNVHIDHHGAGATQPIESRLHDLCYVRIERLPEGEARDADAHTGQIERRKLRTPRDGAVHERHVGDVARHRPRNIKDDFKRHNAVNWIRLVGGRV